MQEGGGLVPRSSTIERPPEAVWLFMDMLHLIMLLANQTNAKKDVLQIWFQEAKIFLLGMKLKYNGLRF